jgi:hypothetical protein
MISGKALLVSVPLLVAGGILMSNGHARVDALRAELASTEAQARAEGASYLSTLQGAHAQRQLELLTQRHEVALRLAGARRDRLLGLLVVLAGLLIFGFVQAAQRIAGEIDAVERLPGRSPAEGGGAVVRDREAATRTET